MAQASMRTVLIDVLARRIIALQDAAGDYLRHGGINVSLDAGRIAEVRLIARLCGVEAEVEAQIAKIERERAKGVTP